MCYVCLFRFAEIWTHAQLWTNGFKKKHTQRRKETNIMFFKRFSIHLVNGYNFIFECTGRHKANWNLYALCARYGLVTREVERSVVLLRFFFLLRRFNNKKTCVCVSFSCLFILQHNCGLNTISMRHRNEIEERLLFGGCNGLLIRPSNKYMTTAALHSDQQQQPGCAIATVFDDIWCDFFFLSHLFHFVYSSFRFCWMCIFLLLFSLLSTFIVYNTLGIYA